MKSIFAPIAVTVLLALCVTGCDSGSKTSAKPPLQLKVSREGYDLSVTNKESAAVTDCWVQINGDFEVRGVSLPAGQATMLSLSQFSKSDGTRFNLVTQDVKRILVQCFTPNGGSRAAQFG